MTQKIPTELLQPTWSKEQKKKHKEVQEYTLMDDIFMSTVLSDPSACQQVLRIILQEPKLIVRESYNTKDNAAALWKIALPGCHNKNT